MNTPQKLQSQEDELMVFMTQEIAVLREILANLQTEQYSLLQNDEKGVKAAMDIRAPLLKTMHHWRVKMIKSIKHLAEILRIDLKKSEDLTLQDWLSLIVDIIGHDQCEILYLRDQILALVDRIDKINNRNHFLLELKHHEGYEPEEAMYRMPRLQPMPKPNKPRVTVLEEDMEA